VVAYKNGIRLEDLYKSVLNRLPREFAPQMFAPGEFLAFLAQYMDNQIDVK